MRARHRHFNPRAVGAYAAFDARYGFSQADNTDVDTWEDRTTGNKDATGTSTSRPKYRTAVMGGNPVVRFDGTNDYLKVDNLTASKVTLMCVASSTLNTNQHICIQWGSVDAQNNQFHLWITSSKYGCFFRDSANVDRDVTATDNKTSNPTIVSTLFDSVQRIFENGKAGGTANTNGTLKQSASQIGIGVKLKTDGTPGTGGDAAYLNGDLGALTIIASALENPIRKRLEHAAAFSFKISCN